MAAPFAYPGTQFYYPTPYISPFYNTPQISPFIPPVTLPGSPHFGPQPERRVRWEDEPPFPRQRRPSWHGGLAPPPNPVPFPSPPIFVTPLPHVMPLPGQAPMPAFTHQRRRSDTCLPLPAWVTYPTMLHPAAFQSPQPVAASTVPQIHPLLDGESMAGPKLLFDLSYHTFSPQRITSYNQTSGTPLTLDDLLEPATYPPVRRMTIKSELISEWPIVLEPHTTSRERSRERSPFLSVSPREAEDAPITVYDVLMAIYRTLQRRITQTDWARLSARQVNTISAAYTRRSRTYPSAQAFEDAQGVRRVDYLGEQYMFRGIMRESVQDGFSKMKLLVGPAR
ncbi:hypothetical protein K466DRAFT_568118 [Polyporus arcularius HHB13444]|uniref:DUF6699 domain-containing protein n=1 Tax=Polyporus arcularius HHB13444 TaxID=1314778 RepID=A0A5C3P0Z4_9APHY|nr:hypothetical protein K466DRAFT_568118 [Polyporus arcularius HHB13444]